jgi:hypothetical protein
MKALSEYSWADWRRLRPLTHWLKSRRYDALREAYVRQPARGGDAGLAARVRGRRVLVTIAFNEADLVGMQVPAVARFVPNALHVIADNSNDESAAMAIAAIAARAGAGYVRLPDNPWRGGDNASRSHGLALNWVWRNIVLPGEPQAFGFLDDDLFPAEADDPFALLQRQPVYGVMRGAGTRWFLWAGFCFFRFDAVRNLPLDFGQDWFAGLDTGGGNWNTLYRALDRNALSFTPTHVEPYKPGADPVKGAIQWCGAWLHEVGWARRDGLMDIAADKRRAVKQLLAARMAAGAPVGSATMEAFVR